MLHTHGQTVPQSSPVLTQLLREASDRGLVIAFAPAHEEQAFIGKTVRWLAEQSSPPDLIVIRP